MTDVPPARTAHTSGPTHVAIDPFDIDLSFGVHRFGAYDPTASREPGVLRKAFIASGGEPCVMEVRAEVGGVSLAVDGNAQAAEVALVDLASALEQGDGQAGFAPPAGATSIDRLHRAHRGLRLVRVPWRFDHAAVAVLQQRVTTREAMQQWRRIAQKYGTQVGDLRAFPGVDRVAEMASWQIEELGVDPKRARTLVMLARDMARRKTLELRDLSRVRVLLGAVRGVGPWTTEMVMGFAFGDPDALPLADLHLPHMVAWALARERRGTDERMVQLLEPYRGHRFRVIRLLWVSGAAKSAPR